MAHFSLQLSLCMIAVLVGNLAAQEPADFRIWTDLQKRKIEAAFESSDKNKVVLKLRNGERVTVSILTLSENDRIWVMTRGILNKEDNATANSLKADHDWPRTIALKAAPVVKVIQEDSEKKEYVYETEHYEFLSDSPLGANLVREFSRIFEATWLVNCLLPLDFKPKPEGNRTKFRAYIYTHESDYHEAGGPEGSAGVYIPRDSALKLPLASLGVKMFGSRVTIDYVSENYRTLVHEITHQMMNHWIPRLPIWYVEGAAEYVEIAKYENGRFSFLQQDRSLRERLFSHSSGIFRMVPLEKLMNLNSVDWMTALVSGESDRNYASAAALTYYFYHLDDSKGSHFKGYIHAIEKLNPSENDVSLVQKHLLRGRDYIALQKDVQKQFRRLGISLEFE